MNGQDTRFNQKNPDKPEVTEYMDPEIKVITPGAIPSDATVLFDGKNLDEWADDRDTTQPAKWIVAGDNFTVTYKVSVIRTIRRFIYFQWHLEYRIRPDITASGQPRCTRGFLSSALPW
mgnify:CR=1 FL=1